MTKKSKGSLALTVSDGTPEFLKELNERIAALKHIEDTVYKTTGNLQELGFPTNIQQEMKIENLIRAHSAVVTREELYNKSASLLGIKTFPAFNVAGGNSEQWEHDIKLRIEILTHKEQLDKLNSFKTKMESFLSEQDKKALLIKEMQDYFSK